MNLNQSSESTVIVFYEVFGAHFLDVRVDPRHRYVVSYSHIASRISPNLQIRFVFRVQYKENFAFRKFFFLVAGTQSLQNDKVVFGTVHFDDVHDAVVQIYREGELLFAQFAVHFFVFYNHVSFHCLHGFVPFQPLAKAF